jgi:hypothetical protein
MGFSIPRGIRFKSTEFADIHSEIARWRVKLRVLTQEKTDIWLAQRVTNLIDDPMSKGELAPSRPLGDAWRTLRDDQKKIIETQGRNPRVDFEFKLWISPFEGRIYGNIACEHEDWVKKFMRMRIAEDFSYWNNCDRPDRMSYANWQERERIWEGVYKDQFAYGANTFLSECTTPTHIVAHNKKNVLHRIVSYDSRVKRVAVNVVVNNRMTVDPEVIACREKDDGSVSAYSHAFFKAHDWLKTEAGQTMLGIEMGHMRNLLVPEITEEML